MHTRCTFVLALVGTVVAPSLAKDWVFVTTNWNEYGNEKVLLVDPENGQTRTLWNTGTELDAVVSADATRLYVTSIGDKGSELTVIDAATAAVLNKTETPQLIRWIFPSTPGMAISSDGRWLYLLKTNYSAGSSEYSLLTFDTHENRFLSEEQAISNCPRPYPLPLPGDANVLMLCGGRSESQKLPPFEGLAWHLPHDFANFALGRGSDGHTLYLAGWDGSLQAGDVATHKITRTSEDSPLRYRQLMPSSGTISPDGRVWYLPIKIPNNGEQNIEQILVFDTQNMKMAGIITPPGPFWGLALSSDGRLLYASQPDMQSLMVIDTETHRCVRVIRLGAKPFVVLAVKAP